MPNEPRTSVSLPAVLVALTVTTGLIDGVRFLANMMGNVVFLRFALAGVPGLSVARSLVALAAFLVGATCPHHSSSVAGHHGVRERSSSSARESDFCMTM